MNFMFNLIMFVCMYPVVLILYFVANMASSPNKNTLLGVTLSVFLLADKEVAAITKRYKRQLNRITLALAVLPFFSFLIPGFAFAFTFWMMWLLLVMGALSVPYIIAYRDLTHFKEEYIAKADDQDAISLDEDEHWILGVLYYNKNDTHALVEKRYGMGSTVNMATGFGKGLMAFTGLSLLAIPISCILVIMLEITPIDLALKGNTLVATQINTDYEIAVEDIDSVELIHELPDRSRTNGTGMENLQKGHFSVEGYGSSLLFLNPQNQVFLVIQAEGKTYFFSDRTDKETMEVYHQLENLQ